jgi:hypothetical protein
VTITPNCYTNLASCEGFTQVLDSVVTGPILDIMAQLGLGVFFLVIWFYDIYLEHANKFGSSFIHLELYDLVRYH